jgi:ribulose-phosphate 3-epimerase
MKALPSPRQIVPSVLSASFAHLSRDVKVVQDAGAQSVQIDVMDGHFVPNITVGPVVIESLRKETSIFLDVHLMITDPLKYAPEFAKAGADLLTLHYEACSDPVAAIQTVKKLGVRVGMAIRPKTPVDVLYPLLKDLDVALVMTVEPGFGGQAFMPDMLEKVRALRQKLGASSACQIQVDGGINLKTAPLAAQAGADSMVAGSSVYGAKNVPQAFQQLQSLVDLP